MERSGTSVRVATALAITVVFWGAAFPLIKSAGKAYGGGELALLRFLIAGVALGVAAVVMRIGPPKREDAWKFFLTGLLGVAIYHPCLNYGEEVVAAGTASMLINSAPVWTAIFATFLLGEKISLRKGVGIAISFVGIALLAFGEKGRLEIEPAATLVVTSAVCAALYVIAQKKYLSAYGALEFTLWTVWAGVILMAPVFGMSTLREVIAAPARATVEVAFLGVFPAAIAYMMFAYATVRMPASRVMTFMYLIPPVAIAISWVYLGEVPTWVMICGGCLAIGGVAVVNSARTTAARVQPLITAKNAADSPPLPSPPASPQSPPQSPPPRSSAQPPPSGTPATPPPAL
jgi:drug/metabolite transporter (DMT)-like permease